MAYFFKHTFLTAVLLAASSLCGLLSAQNTLKGRVSDQKGNPVQNASVVVVCLRQIGRHVDRQKRFLYRTQPSCRTRNYRRVTHPVQSCKTGYRYFIAFVERGFYPDGKYRCDGRGDNIGHTSSRNTSFRRVHREQRTARTREFRTEHTGTSGRYALLWYLLRTTELVSDTRP